MKQKVPSKINKFIFKIRKTNSTLGYNAICFYDASFDWNVYLSSART